MTDEAPLRLLLIVAHPDDAEARCGGLMTRYRKAGHAVKWISMTNGDAGHHKIKGAELAAIRKTESENAVAVIGAECEIWDTPDGHLEPSLELRWGVIRAIRAFQPDLVVTHRTCDYHPDHRAVGQLVQDASFSVTVPALVPDTPALEKDPVIASMADLFTRPNRLRSDIIHNVDPYTDTIIDLFSCHASQVFEWLPHNMGITDPVPDGADERHAWMRKHFMTRLYEKVADAYRAELIAEYGEAAGSKVQLAEVYEISEYARPLDDELKRRLFDLA